MNRCWMIFFSCSLLLGLLIFSSSQALARGEPVKLTSEKEGFICPVWSPDGRSIAVTRDGWAGIWRMNSHGTELEELTADRGAGYKFAWSPDGRHIAYRAEKMVGGKRYFAIKVVDVEDKTARQITEFQRFLGTPRWISPDGIIVFETDRDGSLEQVHAAEVIPAESQKEPVGLMATTSKDLQIWVSKPDGGEKTLISDPDDRCFGPILSPDGRWICYISLEGGGSIAVAHTDGTGRINLGYGSNPCWSPDGQSLVYEITQDDGMVITGSDLYLIEHDGGGRVQLTDTPDIIERWPNWSPDGSRIAYSAGGAIYVIAVQSAIISQE